MTRETISQIMQGVEHEGRPRKVDHNTVEYQRADVRVIRLHHTDIVEITEDRWRLNSGGWKTPTTKDRLNKFSPARIHSDRGVWRLSDGSTFFDGIEVNSEGRALNPRPDVEAEQRKLGKAINAFVKRLDDMETLPMPGAGDCWFCSMFEREPSRGEQGFHERGSDRNPEHLLSHIEDGYLHGWLLVNAMRWAGYGDEGISYMLDPRFTSRTSVKSALRRYLRHRLGLAQ